MDRQQADRKMTTAEWAKALGCSPEVIRYAIRKRKLLAERAPFSRGHSYIIAARDIKSWLERVKYG